MKRFLLVFGIALLFSVTYASAAPNLDVPSSIDLGEKSRNETATATFTITNTGNVTLTNVTPISDIAVLFNATGFNLAVNESTTIRLNTTIPSNSPTGNITLGTVRFISNEYNSSASQLKVTVRGGLRIDDLDVRLILRNGKSKTHTDVTDGAKLDFGDDYDIGPSSTLEFEFKIENEFLDKDDVEIQDVSVLVTIKGIDDGDDIDEESESFDIKAEGKENTLVSLKIPLKVEEGNYDIEIVVKGEDTDNVEHKVEWNLEMELKKESHEIYIASAHLVKDTLSCSRVSSLKTKIINLGNRDEDDVKIEVKNSQLGLDFVKSGITLVEDPYDSDNEYEKTIPIVVGDDVKAGTYPIEFNVYIKGSVLFETTKVDLVVEDCETKKTAVEENKTKEEKNESMVVEEGKEGVEIPILSQQEKTVTKEKEPFSTNKIVTWSIAATIIIIILLVIIAFLYAPKQKTA
jgi:hypothetical protein